MGGNESLTPILHPSRLEALQRLELLETPPEPSFDRLTKLTARYLEAPVALVSLVDADRQFFKSACGLPEPWASRRETPLSHSFCKHVVASGTVLAIEDAREHPLVNDNAAIRTLGIIAYLGVPLVSPEGQVVGSLCAIDTQPRKWAADDIETLEALAALVTTEIQLRADLQARKNAEEKAESANRAKDQFLASLSHELRAPLTPVLLCASDLENDELFPEKYREDIRLIRRNVEMEALLIDDLLDLTRITHGKLDLRRTLAEIHPLIRLALRNCQYAIRSKELNVVLNFEAKRCAVHGDEARLQQVIWNLLKNAVKFTPKGGTITVATQDLPENGLGISVTDTGIGIATENLQRIFEAFEQAESRGGGARQFGGLGLGLAISRSLVSAHHGTLTAHSEGLRQGARFAVELPGACEPATGREIPSRRKAAVAPARGRRVLLVEDHADSARILARLLERAGNEVTVAHTKASALKSAAERSFDLLLSDVALPDGSGLDLVRQIGPITAIALTGYGTEDDRRRAESAGFKACLVKPLEFAKLQAAIERAFASD